MPFISVTRLRSVVFVPAFGLQTMRSLSQVRRASGFVDGGVLQDRRWTFWTKTAWDTEAQMRACVRSGDHRTAMPQPVD